VGSGPSGFYAAESLFRREGLAVRVDMFDRLPTPYGLVRYGVAPDHAKMRAVIRTYDKTAQHEGFRFFGHVHLGRDLRVADLRAHYDAVIYATGAETDRRLGVPGEELAGSHSATAFVGWYNGHPDHRDGEYDLSCGKAIVFGVGNVAMDVARILMRDPDELAGTDIADHALEALRTSRVREVTVVGRRAAAQAAFSTKEITELGSLAGVDLIVDPADLELDEATERDVLDDTTARKNLEYLTKRAEAGPAGHDRRIVLCFLASPAELLGEDGHVSAVRLERNRIERGEDGWPGARPTGEFFTRDAGLVFRAIGYRGEPLPDVPFDPRRGIIPNADGRVTETPDGDVVPGQYVVGWAKRGPTGLIGTNKACSFGTVDALVEDLPRLGGDADAPDILELLRERNVRFVTFDDWRRLDAIEVERGEAMGRIRSRFSRVEDMLDALANSAESAPERG
jgi:ferredoxin/flavodoxin---NADP+ reductase